MEKYLLLLKKHLIKKEDNVHDSINALSIFRGLDNNSFEMDIDTFLSKYFPKDSVKNYCLYHFDHFEKWAKCFAAKPLYGIRVNPTKLEPFVTRYVNAINGIGSKTYESCDGWHFEKDKSKELYIIFKDRYSRIWHKVVSQLFLAEKSEVAWKYNGNKMFVPLPDSDLGKLKIYILINKEAELFEEIGSYILNLKKNVIAKMKNEIKNPLSDELIEKRFLECIGQ